MPGTENQSASAAAAANVLSSGRTNFPSLFCNEKYGILFFLAYAYSTYPTEPFTLATFAATP